MQFGGNSIGGLWRVPKSRLKGVLIVDSHRNTTVLVTRSLVPLDCLFTHERTVPSNLETGHDLPGVSPTG